LLTGLFPHQTGLGILTSNDRPFGYPGSLRSDNVTIAEAFRAAGYGTGLSGKWHLAHDTHQPNESWPRPRGFEHFFGTLAGAGSYYDPGTLTRGEEPADDALDDPDFHYTDAIATDAAGYIAGRAGGAEPFFLYVAFTAPHWPLHARPEDIARHDGAYDAGWDAVRAARFVKQQQIGVAADNWTLSPRDPVIPPWTEVPDRGWQVRRMQAYAAMVEQLDRGVGQIVAALEANDQLDDTVVVFLSDNGPSEEEIPRVGLPLESLLARTDIVRAQTRDGRPVRIGNRPEIEPGPEDTYASYGVGWADVSNTPFRLYKRWTHEGGIATPLIVSYPRGGVEGGSIVRDPYQISSLKGTLLELAGVPDLSVSEPDAPVPTSPTMTGSLRGEAPGPSRLCWEHIGNAAIRTDRWKLVRKYGQPWELYDLERDPIELEDLASAHPTVVADLERQWQEWATEAEVIPFETIVTNYEGTGRTLQDAQG
jgi:arylsulfatase A-like enzyme